jgi:uncharacterized membrane protein
MKHLLSTLILLSLISLTLASTIQDKTPTEVLTDAGEATGEKLSDIGKNSDFYANLLADNLLKFQEFFMGTMNFITLGYMEKTGDLAFAAFLLFILLFMTIYTIISSMFNKFTLPISFLITSLAFISMPKETIENIFFQYEAMGIAVTIILPILILLAFTFKIYDKAYSGKSSTSPFYAEMFNLAFLVFFGIFFIRHSKTEEGVIATMRFLSGIFLIFLGIAQTLFYKSAARFFHKEKLLESQEKIERKKEKQKALENLDMKRLESYKEE